MRVRQYWVDETVFTLTKLAEGERSTHAWTDTACYADTASAHILATGRRSHDALPTRSAPWLSRTEPGEVEAGIHHTVALEASEVWCAIPKDKHRFIDTVQVLAGEALRSAPDESVFVVKGEGLRDGFAAQAPFWVLPGDQVENAVAATDCLAFRWRL
jgi:hypothetical protein